MDLSAPLFVGVGVKGNSVVLIGDNKGQGSYALGLTADVDSKYLVSLKYNAVLAKRNMDDLGATSTATRAWASTGTATSCP